MRAIQEEIVGRADRGVPCASIAISAEEVRRWRRFVFTPNAPNANALVIVRRKQRKPFERQRRTMMNQIDIMVPGPDAGQICHEQLGPADAVSHTVFDVETN